MVNGLSDCLQEANLAQYTNNFLQLGVCSLDSLSRLTMQEYSQFGITNLADKKRLFHLIHIVKRVKSDKGKTPEQQEGSGINPRTRKSYQQQLSHDNNNRCVPLRDEPKTEPSLPCSASSIKSSSSGPKTNSPPKRTDSLLSVARKDLKKGALSPGTLRKLETTGGILFVKSTSASAKTRPGSRLKPNARKKLLLRESLSDSEINDSDFTDSNTVAIDRTNFGAPRILKKSFIEVIDHRESVVYNYGVPGQEQSTRQHRAHGTPQGSSNDEVERIKVCVRKRPLNKKEEKDNEVDVVQMEGGGTVIMNEAKVAVDLTKFMQVHKYHFDEVFGESCSNEEVYARTAKPLISTMFNRGKATCFAYGQTGAGKTHTMLGNSSVRGLYLLTAEDIFATLNASKQSGNELGVWASYFEIYCGQLFDLLNDRQRVHAREDSQHHMCIAGINKVQVSGSHTLMQVVEQGNKLRSKGVSGVNADSSRSHAILQLQLQDGGRRKLGRFSFIDLAGSERACDTVDPDRVTRYEGAEINTSLLALKECIRALDQEQRHTPFRQSKLTQVLRDSFLGHSKTCMIANIAPNSSAVDHTLNTLRYADRVKELKKETSSRTTASPYPSTPNTFSPGTTSTPLKMSNKQTQSPKAQMTTPSHRPKGTTPGSMSCHQNLSSVKKVTPVRKVSSEKASVKLGSQQKDSRSTRKLDESRDGGSDSRKNVSQEVDNQNRKNCETSASKPMPKISDAKTQRHNSTRKSSATKKGLNVTFDGLKSNNETPSKRSEEVKVQTKEAFLQGKVLPVWNPPEESEHPKALMKTPGEAWEIDNPRYAHSPKMTKAAPEASPLPHRDTTEKIMTSEPSDSKTLQPNKKLELQESYVNTSEQYLADQESGFLADDEMAENWSKRNDSSTMMHSLQSRRSETSCSTDTDSTIELLAEIDYALRNSLVSPVSDNGLGDNQPAEAYPTCGVSHSRGDDTSKQGQRHRTRSAPQPNIFPEHHNVPSVTGTFNNDWTIGKQVKSQHAMSLHPEIRINKSPDSMSTDSLQDLEAERLLANDRQKVNKDDAVTPKNNESRIPVNRTDPLPSQGPSSSFRSKLTVKGIESLPSPRDVQQVAPQTTTDQNREVTNVENPSGVIVSTCFHDYVASAGPHPTTQAGPLIFHAAEAAPIRPAPIGQHYNSTVANTTMPFKNRSDRRLPSSLSAGLQSPITVEVLRTEHRSSAFSPIADITRSNPSPSVSIPNKAFMKEALSSSVHPEQIRHEITPKQSPIAKEKIVLQHHPETSQLSFSQNQSSNSEMGSSGLGKGIGGNTGGLVPRLHLAGMVTGGSDVRRHLLSPRQNSAIEKAKELLVSAHAEQIDELERLCEREWRLIKQLHSGEKGLSEYLRYTKDLMTSKLRCIDTFQDQLSTFSRCSTPDVSPRSRSPMEAW